MNKHFHFEQIQNIIEELELKTKMKENILDKVYNLIILMLYNR